MKNICSFKFLRNNHFELLVCAISLLLLLTYSQMALAANNNDNRKVAAKCHVVLVGGTEAISFWTIQQKKLQKLKDNIVGKKIQPLGSTQKISIYQAFECVLEDGAFQSTKARLLDSKTPR